MGVYVKCGTNDTAPLEPVKAKMNEHLGAQSDIYCNPFILPKVGWSSRGRGGRFKHSQIKLIRFSSTPLTSLNSLQLLNLYCIFVGAQFPLVVVPYPSLYTVE